MISRSRPKLTVPLIYLFHQRERALKRNNSKEVYAGVYVSASTLYIYKLNN